MYSFHEILSSGILDILKWWGLKSPVRLFQLYKRYRLFQEAELRRKNQLLKNNLVVPPVIIFSATMRCNFNCPGCYSRNQSRDDELHLHEIESLFAQAQDLGVGFFVITGGEPLLRKGLLELMRRQKRLIFLLFTNGSFIDQACAQTIARSDNIVPVISIEGASAETDGRRGAGAYAKIHEALNYLKKARALFGFSAMANRKNLATLCDEAFYRSMMAQGCRIGFCIQYVPVKNDIYRKFALSEEEQKQLRRRVVDFQKRLRLVLVHMPDDEYDREGACMAAGRGFVHVNAQGYVEPCPFAHFAVDSIRSMPLHNALASPFFSWIRENKELLARPTQGCALFERRAELMNGGSKFGAVSTEIAQYEPA